MIVDRKTGAPVRRALVNTLCVAALLMLSFPQIALAQQTGTITGSVVDARTGEGLVGANMIVVNTLLGAAAGDDGRFTIDEVPVGSYTVRARFIGFGEAVEAVTVSANATTTVRFELKVEPIGLTSIEVAALRPDLQPQATLEERAVRETNPRDSGELLRIMPGINAARRGPIGLDPNVRGLVETEVGAYVDGVRRFPAGPLRMDSQVSHFDPSTIDRVEIVKGPYALIWGAGNMSAIRVHTKTVSPAAGLAHGFIRSSFDSNQNALGLSGAIFGSEDDFTFWIHGAYREGDDYESGDGAVIPGDFTSGEVRGKVSYQLSPTSRFTVGGGYQDQRDIDYPGRLLDADFFEAADVSGHYELSQPGEVLRRLDALVYWHRVDHGMDNDEKPTRSAGTFPNGNPRPPLIITVDSEMRNLGGRLAAEIVPDDAWTLTVGGDVYSANRDAVRPFQAETPMGLVVPPFYASDEIWPDVTITDAGLFANGRRAFGTVTASGSARVDFVSAEAGRVSQAYLDNTGATPDDLDDSETNLSGALTLAVPLAPEWLLSMGVGSVVRTADPLERYADRFPASKAQTAAEFVGNPTLDPERSTQVDVWLEANYARIAFDVNGFYRQMDNYITLEPTDIGRMLPLSPPTVFRYVNGEATFYGFEASVAVALMEALTANVSTSYLWGEDAALDEPALGVSPFETGFGLRYETRDGRFFVEGVMHAVAEQDRVAATRGEIATEGYITADARAGLEVSRGVSLLLGVTNLTDEEYVNHLNAKNPFTATPIPEPGRIFFGNISLAF